MIEELKSLKIDNSFCYLVGDQLDSEDKIEVEEEEAKIFAKEKEIIYKSGENIKELFEDHIHQIILKKEKDEEEKKEKMEEEEKEKEKEKEKGNEIINDKEDKEEENEDSEKELKNIKSIEQDIKKYSLEEHNKLDANSFIENVKYICVKNAKIFIMDY